MVHWHLFILPSHWSKFFHQFSHEVLLWWTVYLAGTFITSLTISDIYIYGYTLLDTLHSLPSNLLIVPGHLLGKCCSDSLHIWYLHSLIPFLRFSNNISSVYIFSCNKMSNNSRDGGQVKRFKAKSRMILSHFNFSFYFQFVAKILGPTALSFACPPR